VLLGLALWSPRGLPADRFDGKPVVAVGCGVLALRADIPQSRGAFVTVTSRTPAGIAYDRAGPRADLPVVLIHASVADRRMWDPQWPALTTERDVVRLDLRGFGESTVRPPGLLSPVDDVLDTLAELGIGRCHLVGASFGAGVAVEVALTRPEQVDSLLLSAPGGSLIAEVTPDLRAFIGAERSALARDDLDGAVEANLAWWVDGPGRDAGDDDPTVRDLVRQMQRRAFELTADWDDIEDRELEPAALDRLAEIGVPTLVLVGALDLQAIHDAARRVTDGIAGARRVDWPGTAHLPSMDRPDDFLALLRDWLPRRSPNLS
jgi:pimeloyl-ACP methyl ester carboxylesterase